MILKKKTLLLLVGALTLAASVPAMSANSQSSGDSNRGSQQSRYQDTSSQKNQSKVKLQGTVKGFTNIELKNSKGRSQEFVLAKVQTKQGRTALVNLGLKSRLDQNAVKVGDRITVDGRRGRIDGNNVVLAKSFKPERSNGQNNNRSRQSDSQSSANQGMKRVTGEIDGFKSIKLKNQEGRSEEHSFVRLKMQDGRRLVVGLGPDTRSLQQLDLNQGDVLGIHGKNTKIDGRKVLMADKIRVAKSREGLKSKSGTGGSNQSVNLSGEVDGFRKASLGSGQQSQQTIARVRLDRGKSALVALGTDTMVRNLDIKSGDRIKIKGHNKQINGQQLIVANRILVNGSVEYRRNM